MGPTIDNVFVLRIISSSALLIHETMNCEMADCVMLVVRFIMIK